MSNPFSGFCHPHDRQEEDTLIPACNRYDSFVIDLEIRFR